MKKLISLILAILLVFSFSGCGKEEKKTPANAKEYYIESYNNLSSTPFDFDAEIYATATVDDAEESAKFTVNGSTSKNGDMKGTYMFTFPAITLSGDFYVLAESRQVYMQAMGVWIKFDLEVLYTYSGMNADEILKDFPIEKVTAEEFDKAGLVFSEITEKDGMILFDIFYDPTAVRQLILDNMDILESEFGTMDDESIDEFFDILLPIIEKVRFKVEINKADCTLRTMSADFMSIVESLEEYLGEAPITGLGIVMSIYDHGEENTVSIPEFITGNALDLMEQLGYEAPMNQFVL